MRVDHTNIFSAVEMLMSQMNDIQSVIKEIKPTVEDAFSQKAKANDPIDIEEVCRITKKARSTIYRLSKDGTLPCYKKGKRLYFFRNEVMDWIRHGKRRTYSDFTMEAAASYRRKS